MICRILVHSKIPDTRAKVRQKSFQNFSFHKKIESVKIIDVYTIVNNLSDKDLYKIAETLINPVTEYAEVIKNTINNTAYSDNFFVNLFPDEDRVINYDWAIEIGFLPGVTDNIGNTTKVSAEDHLKIKFKNGEGVYSSQITLVLGKLSNKEVSQLSQSLFNPLIQRSEIKSSSSYEKENGMEFYVPVVDLHHNANVSEVDLNIPDEDLIKLGKLGIENPDGTRRGPLALDLDYLKTIQKYFKELKRNPTDIEIETIAQTWSEHCKHTIFADPIDDIKDGLFKHFIKGATEKIGKKDFVAKVFNDNSGAINFDENFLITHKVETHNTPSALDPFGGAITGIVGVNRDAMGFGLGAKPIFNTYGFMFGDPEDEEPLYKDPELTQKMLSPKRIMEGVIAGINAGGNQSGIPTPIGILNFDDRYKGKPLVFAGTVGLIPKKSAGRDSKDKKAEPGDLIVMVGGKVGVDGIHGATFSSEGLGADSPSTAVQIGDPITQKKFSDAIIKEARDKALYNSITDCGAGGLSSSVGEMARESGGCLVNLENVPLKYSGLDPWQIWISESQERMVLSIPKAKFEEFKKLMLDRDVNCWEIGEFTDSGKCIVNFNNKKVLDLDLEFLHDGLPKRNQELKIINQKLEDEKMEGPQDFNKVFLNMLNRLNISSYDFISTQYDHTVQGTAVSYPVVGKGRINADSAVVRPVLNSDRGLVLSQGFYPSYSDINTYDMAAASLDTAVKNAILTGANPEKIALLDNFCWCSSNEPERLYQLKKACEAIYDGAVEYSSPFISGKDSMFNDFKGFDKNGKSVKISIPPTLLISSIGIIEDVKKYVSPEFKVAGDLIYILGETKNELGGSEYLNSRGMIGKNVPKVDFKKNLKLYKALAEAINRELIASSIGVGRGGLAIALAKASIGGMTGIDVKLSDFENNTIALFSESQGRILISIDPKNKNHFEEIMKDNYFKEIGTVVDSGKIKISGTDKKMIIEEEIKKAAENYKARFMDW